MSKNQDGSLTLFLVLTLMFVSGLAMALASVWWLASRLALALLN